MRGKKMRNIKFLNEFCIKRKILAILGVLPFFLMRPGFGMKAVVTCVKKLIMK